MGHGQGLRVDEWCHARRKHSAGVGERGGAYWGDKGVSRAEG